MAWLRRTPARVLDREYPPPDEQHHIDSLIRVLRRKMERDYAGATVLRDAHPKLHGCVRAEFSVRADLEPELAVGVFEPGRVYRALVRFSNQNATVSSDSARDIRGAAIKLFGVDPPVIEQDNPGEVTQDFILITVDRFVTADVAQFDGLVRALVGGLDRKAFYFLRHPRVLRNLLASLRHHDNPLGARYFSVSPYRLGARAVKYSLSPRSPALLPESRGRDHLRHAMANQLGRGDAVFEFAVQLQSDPRRMPIEDAGVTWSEARAPFRAVASLHIPQQEFDTDEMRGLAENLAFNPWHCRPEHAPIGGINRARRQVYRALADFRRERNGVRPVRTATAQE
jgi:hypothetical protein